MRVSMEQGRFAEAEQIVTDALADPRIDGSSVRIVLGSVYRQEGRVDEIPPLMEAHWNALDQAGEGASEAAISLVRGYIQLRLSPVPINRIRFALDQAAQLAPSDDRVWLGAATWRFSLARMIKPHGSGRIAYAGGRMMSRSGVPV